jgi:hypothetical protein
MNFVDCYDAIESNLMSGMCGIENEGLRNSVVGKFDMGVPFRDQIWDRYRTQAESLGYHVKAFQAKESSANNRK